MKKILFKIISLFLCVASIFSVVFCAASAGSDSAGTDIPVIYMCGQGAHLYMINESGEREQIYPVEISADDLIQAAKDNIGILAKAVITQEWTEFGNLIRDIIAPYYKRLALDENGEPVYPSSCFWSYSKETLNAERVDGKFPFRRFEFAYDWRLDPYKIADQLHQYIKDVIEVTGCDRVAILSRCLAGCITTAYMEKYDGEYVSDIIFYSTAHKGVEICSKSLAGDYYFDADAVERYIYNMELSTDNTVNELIRAFVTVFNDMYAFDLPLLSINSVWDNIYIDSFPQVLIDSLGTWPSFWSMVQDKDYARAKETVFCGRDINRWSNFIEIIDNYHYNIQLKSDEILKKFADRGVMISVISKYGFQSPPLIYPSDSLSDGICSLRSSSLGATTSAVNSVLSSKYINLHGTEYLSPDKQVDASSCLFPERTWFIKNLYHKDFPNVIDSLLCKIINTHSMTVFSDENYPQYLVYDNDTVSPMTQDNCHTEAYYNVTFFKALKTFFKSLFEIIIRSFEN